MCAVPRAGSPAAVLDLRSRLPWPAVETRPPHRSYLGHAPRAGGTKHMRCLPLEYRETTSIVPGTCPASQSRTHIRPSFLRPAATAAAAVRPAQGSATIAARALAAAGHHLPLGPRARTSTDVPTSYSPCATHRPRLSGRLLYARTGNALSSVPPSFPHRARAGTPAAGGMRSRVQTRSSAFAISGWPRASARARAFTCASARALPRTAPHRRAPISPFSPFAVFSLHLLSDPPAPVDCTPLITFVEPPARAPARRIPSRTTEPPKPRGPPRNRRTPARPPSCPALAHGAVQPTVYSGAADPPHPRRPDGALRDQRKYAVRTRAPNPAPHL